MGVVCSSGFVLGSTAWFFFLQSASMIKFMGKAKFIPVQVRGRERERQSGMREERECVCSMCVHCVASTCHTWVDGLAVACSTVITHTTTTTDCIAVCSSPDVVLTSSLIVID